MNLLSFRCHVWILFLILFCTSRAVADPPELAFSNLSSEQGLSNSTVLNIYQDSYGFMWFATGDGLNRYDGVQVQVYRNDPKSANSLSDNYVKQVFEDSERNLWICTSNGLNLFDRRSGRFKRYFLFPSIKDGDSRSDISCILEDSAKNLWVGTQGSGLLLFDKKTRSLRTIKLQYRSKSAFKSNQINHLFEDKKRKLWISTSQGIVILDLLKKEFNGFEIPHEPRLDVRVVNEDKIGNKWIGTEGRGVFMYSPATGKLINYVHQENKSSSLGSNLVRSLIIDKTGKIWTGCVKGGLNLFDSKTGSFSRYISDRTFFALFQDKQGNLWAGSHRGGVYLYAPNAAKFETVQKQTSPHILSNNDVRSFFEERSGDMWIGTDGGGLTKYNSKTNTAERFRHQPANPGSLGSDFILDIIEDGNSKMWISTWGAGISMYNKKTKRFTRYSNDPLKKSSISSNYVIKMIPDEKGNLWIGSFGGLNYLNTASGTFTRISSNRNSSTAMWGNKVISICEDVSKGNLWIGTEDSGINYFDRQSQTVKHYFLEGLRQGDISTIFKDQKNRIWVGAKGLYLYNRKKDRFEQYVKASALTSDFVRGILEDNNGNLWISSLNGLVKFNPINGKTKRFNTSDGLQGLEFEANSAFKSQTGKMYFGGVNGYNYFHPDKLTANRFIAPVYFTELYIFNKKSVPLADDSPLTEDLPYTSIINLDHHQSSISVSYAALNYASSNNNQYAYKLEGFDKDWNYVGNSTKASYTNLDPGEYILKVKAANNDALWNTKIARLVIHIKPPYWKTFWFRLLALALVFSVIYYILLVKRKLELEKLEEKKKDEIHQMQLEFFTNISHEFRTPLALILGRLERVAKENHNSQLKPHIRSLFKNSTHLLNLLNELMDFRKAESGALQLNVFKGNINLFLDELTEDFMVLAQKKNIQLSINKNSAITEMWFDPQVVEKIIINLIHNSIKYTAPGGEVLIEILAEIPVERKFENKLTIKSGYQPVEALAIRVVDSGIGIANDSLQFLFKRYYRTTDAHLGSGVGLAFVKSLALLHKGDIYVSSKKDYGTEIIISLPRTSHDYSSTERRKGKSPEAYVNVPDSLMDEPEIGIFDQLPPDEFNAEINFSTGRRHILLVEDNPEMRNLLKESLSVYFNVTEASNGIEAYKKVKEEFPELIISDIMMEGMDGIAFCKKIREDVETSHIPFIMLTAKGSVESQINGIETGADYYFPKPVSMQLLQSTIRNIFYKRQKLKSHYLKDHQAEIREQAHSSKEKEFLNRVLEIIERNMEDPNFDADLLCREIAMSKTSLYHKLKDITGSSIAEFIRTVRLNKAKSIMVKEDVLISEVMFRVGIQTQSYFTRIFKNEFGVTPREFLQTIKYKQPESSR